MHPLLHLRGSLLLLSLLFGADFNFVRPIGISREDDPFSAVHQRVATALGEGKHFGIGRPAGRITGRYACHCSRRWGGGCVCVAAIPAMVYHGSIDVASKHAVSDSQNHSDNAPYLSAQRILHQPPHFAFPRTVLETQVEHRH